MPTLKANVLSLLLPAYLLLLKALLGVEVRLHAPGEEAFIPLEVADVDFVLEEFLPSPNLEVKPLQVASSVAIHPHEAVVLPLPHSNHAVEIASLEERVEDKVILSLPVLSAEGPVGKLHIVGSFDVVVGEAKEFVVPGIVGVFVSRSQVTQLGLLFGLLQHFADEMVETFAVEDHRDWDWEAQFGLPTNHSIYLYPISMSGRSEYDLSFISGGGGILNFTSSLCADYCTACFSYSTIISSCCTYYSEEKPSSIIRSSYSLLPYFCYFSITQLFYYKPLEIPTHCGGWEVVGFA
jgi:hypothetical protein